MLWGQLSCVTDANDCVVCQQAPLGMWRKRALHQSAFCIVFFKRKYSKFWDIPFSFPDPLFLFATWLAKRRLWSQPLPFINSRCAFIFYQPMKTFDFFLTTRATSFRRKEKKRGALGTRMETSFPSFSLPSPTPKRACWQANDCVYMCCILGCPAFKRQIGFKITIKRKGWKGQYHLNFF